MPDAIDILRTHGKTAEGYLRSLRSRYTDAPQSLLDAIDYSLLAGGKRLRPALVLESFAACNGQPEQHPSALAAAGAIELIHTFSLVHDDLPAMDDDDLRRGRPTNHKVFGEAMAILAGDAMVTMAFEIIATDAHPNVSSRLIKDLARATGPAGMIGGQVLDIQSEDKSLSLEELKRLHAMKTGALLTTACRLGAIAAGADEVKLNALTTFGTHLGLAFQIVDDILDLTSTPDQLGKATQKDATHGKNTYPRLLGLAQSKSAAEQELNHAIEALNVFDKSADALRTLARFVAARQS